MIQTYNIPYLSLPTTTPRDVALDVFIKMNTSSVPLTAFDIIVAQLEAATGQPLHDLVADLVSTIPTAEYYRILAIGLWMSQHSAKTAHLHKPVI